MLRHRTHPRTRREGNNAIEFALLLPIMLALISGVIDWGWYYSQHMIVDQAARDGARMGALHPISEDPTAQAATTAWNVLEAHGLSADSAVQAHIETKEDGDQWVTVRITTAHAPLMSLVPIPDALHARSEMRMEWQTE